MMNKEYQDHAVRGHAVKGGTFSSLHQVVDWIGGYDFFLALRRGRFVRYLPQGVFLVVLCVLYIGNRHRVEALISHIDKSKSEVEDARATYMNAKARYMYSLQRMEVVQAVSSIGLVEDSRPAEVVYIGKGIDEH